MNAAKTLMVRLQSRSIQWNRLYMEQINHPPSQLQRSAESSCSFHVPCHVPCSRFHDRVIGSARTYYSVHVHTFDDKNCNGFAKCRIVLEREFSTTSPRYSVFTAAVQPELRLGGCFSPPKKQIGKISTPDCSKLL